MFTSTKRNFLFTLALFVLSLLFTLSAKLFDVAAIGPKNSCVGYSTLNKFVFSLTGENLLWYSITDWLGFAALFTALVFAVVGLCQLVSRRSLFKVDADITLLGVFYIVVMLVYIFFETHIVNYRPVLMDGFLEASYPSSHTMIVCAFMTSAVVPIHRLVKNKTVARPAVILCISVVAVTVVGRLISGVHWFTDIVGGLLIAGFLVMLYRAFVGLFESFKAR